MAARGALEGVVSGGQTGVDRAALDAAAALGLGAGGWCPRGRRAEDGTIPARYRLVETPTPRYLDRSRWNVRDSDATLVLIRGRPSGGTRETVGAARAMGRPLLVVDLDRPTSPAAVRRWLADNGVRVLNVAGPRESECPGIAAAAARFLGAVLDGGGG